MATETKETKESIGEYGSYLHRMYANEWPAAEEVVMVKVTKLGEHGYDVALLEYGEKEALMLYGDVTKRRIKEGQRHLSVGQILAVVVARVDDTKGYVDVSKKRIEPADAKAAEERWARVRTVYNILRHIAETYAGPGATSLVGLYELFVWPVEEERGRGAAYDVLRESTGDPEAAFAEFHLPLDLRDAIAALALRRLGRPPVQLRADVNVTCFSEEGVEGIRRALIAGEEAVEGLKITVQGAPLYGLFFTCTDKNEGCAALERAIAAITHALPQRSSSCVVATAPYVVHE